MNHRDWSEWVRVSLDSTRKETKPYVEKTQTKEATTDKSTDQSVTTKSRALSPLLKRKQKRKSETVTTLLGTKVEPETLEYFMFWSRNGILKP